MSCRGEVRARSRGDGEGAAARRPRGVRRSAAVGDEPAFDGLLDLFPAANHEPYYADYVRHDVAALFADAGLRPVSNARAHMSKVVVAAKP